MAPERVHRFDGGRLTDARGTMFVIATVLLCQWLLRERSFEEVVSRVPWYGRTIAIAGMIILILLTPGVNRAFLYFQF